jgi:hypothetical protein
VVLDGISFLLLAPAALYLTHKCPGKFSQSTAKIYLGVMCLVTTVYPLYNFVIDAPMYMARYHADQAAHKQCAHSPLARARAHARTHIEAYRYLPFIAGLRDAAVHWIPTRNLADWQGDMQVVQSINILVH